MFDDLCPRCGTVPLDSEAVNGALSDLAFALRNDETEIARMHLDELVAHLREDGYQIEPSRVMA